MKAIELRHGGYTLDQLCALATQPPDGPPDEPPPPADDIAPCPGCGGQLEQQSAYDRSAGQYTCAGECGWSWPADRYAHLARAVALLRAAETLDSYQPNIRASVILDTWYAFANDPAHISTETAHLPDALIALATHWRPAMTNDDDRVMRHSADEIVPEPPDDPPDEPTPPDDLAPCPVCGGADMVAAYYTWSMRHFIRCKHCHIDFVVSKAAPDARVNYQRLARAAALLRAAETLDSYQPNIRASVILDTWYAFANDPAHISTETAHLPDALIALAAQMEARDGNE